GEDEHELPGQNGPGAALLAGGERAQPGDVVEAGRRGERGGAPGGAAAATGALRGQPRVARAPRRGEQHVSLVGEAADPDGHPDQVERDRHEAHQQTRRANAAGTSAKSRKIRSGPQARSSSKPCCPVATATATAPQARAHPTSSGVSPMMVSWAIDTGAPVRRSTRAAAIAGSRVRSGSSEP